MKGKYLNKLLIKIVNKLGNLNPVICNSQRLNNDFATTDTEPGG